MDAGVEGIAGIKGETGAACWVDPVCAGIVAVVLECPSLAGTDFLPVPEDELFFPLWFFAFRALGLPDEAFLFPFFTPDAAFPVKDVLAGAFFSPALSKTGFVLPSFTASASAKIVLAYIVLLL